MSTPTPPTPPLGDAISNLVKSATDAIATKYPRTLAVSISLGVFCYWLTQLFKPYLQTLPIDPSELSPYPLVAFFLVIGIIISAVYHPRRELPSSVEDVITYIELAKRRAKLTDMQVKGMYLSFYNKILENVDLSKETKKQLEETKKQLEEATKKP